MMACAGLVLLMIPAVGLFYGGMVRRKNVLSAFQQSFVLLGVVPIQWVVVGYSLSFGPTSSRRLRGLAVVWAARCRARPSPNWRRGSRTRSSWFLRCWSAVVPTVLISGAIAERMKFVSYRALRHFVDDFGLRPGRSLGMESGWLDQAPWRP